MTEIVLTPAVQLCSQITWLSSSPPGPGPLIISAACLCYFALGLFLGTNSIWSLQDLIWVKCGGAFLK